MNNYTREGGGVKTPKNCPRGLWMVPSEKSLKTALYGRPDSFNYAFGAIFKASKKYGKFGPGTLN